MKKKMSITRKLIAFATLFLISCSEDLYEKENTYNNKGVKISKVSLKEPRFQNKTKLIQEVSKIKNKQPLVSNTHRMVYDSINNFYFDDENGTLIENINGYESYTFKVVRETPIDSKLENVIFSQNQEGGYDTYLAKYPVSEEEIKTLSTEEFENMETNFQILNRATQYICITTTIYGGCSETHSNGYTCSGETVTSDCYNMDGGSGGGGSSGGDSGTGTGTGTTWQGGGVSTTPTGGGGGSNTSLNMENFYLSLEFNQQEWFDNQSTETQQSIFNYLNTNGFNTTNKNFIKNLINYLIQNTSLSFNDVFYNKTNFDVNNSLEIDNYTSGGFDTNTYSVFNPQQNWSNISSVIPVSQFVGWGTPGVKRNCMDYAKAQIAKKGYQISAYNAIGQTFQVYTSQNGVNTTNLSQGLSYLKYALSNGIPVVVGVDDAPGHPGNLDSTTDHFIVIVGMGNNSNGNYFQFYDNASGGASQGASPLNLLYYNSTTGIISGSSQTSYGQGQPYPYILTMIRKSKLL